MTIWAIAVAIPALVWLGALLVRNARRFPPEVGPSTAWTGWRTSPFRVGKTYMDADVVAVVFLDALAVRTKGSSPSLCREERWKVTLSSSARRGP